MSFFTKTWHAAGPVDVANNIINSKGKTEHSLCIAVIQKRL